MNEYIGVLKKYWVFSGRATKREYWMFFFMNIAVMIVLSIVTSGMGNRSMISNLYGLAVIAPTIGVAVRRLHDIGKSGNWFFLNLIPFVGSIWLIVLLAKDGQAGDNQYGPDPKPVMPAGTPPATNSL